MGQVAVTVNGRSYRFDCGEGEEARLQELATHVKDRIDKLISEYGHVGSERLMLMAALLITDELWDARAALAEVSSGHQAESQMQDDAEADAAPEEPPRKRAASGDT
jgi:cell division protein ZapA